MTKQKGAAGFGMRGVRKIGALGRIGPATHPLQRVDYERRHDRTAYPRPAWTPAPSGPRLADRRATHHRSSAHRVARGPTGAVEAQARPLHTRRARRAVRAADSRARRGAGRAGREVERQPCDGPARRHRTRHLPYRQVDAGRRQRARWSIQTAADSAVCRLPVSPGPRLPGALPILLPRRIAERPADDARLRQPAADLGQHDAFRAPRRPDFVRSQLLHRSARARAPDGQPIRRHHALRHAARTKPTYAG